MWVDLPERVSHGATVCYSVVPGEKMTIKA